MNYIESFWRKVQKTEGCWLWTAGKNAKGYGIFWCGQFVKAHRYSWALEYEVLGTNWVLHRCDNPSCVRPDHLFLGDSKANVADMWKKGRASPPPPMGGWNKTKIPEDILQQLGKAPDTELAKKIGKDKNVIARAKRELKIPSFPCPTRFKKGMPHPRWSRRKESNPSHGANHI